MDAFFNAMKAKFQKGGAVKKADKTYEDIYKKEGRVKPHYKNQKDIEKNVKSDKASHKKKFKTMHEVSGIQDVSKAKSNKQAFAIARNTGKKNYTYKGKTYSTRYAEETPEQFEKSHKIGTPEYKARVKDTVKRKHITHGSTPNKGDINYVKKKKK